MAVRPSPDRGLQVRMAMLALLVVVANAIFLTLVLEAGLYYANAVIDSFELGLQRPILKRGVEDYWLAVLPLTAVFMLAQYWYVRRSVLRSSAIQPDAPETTDLEKRLTRLAAQASVAPPSVTVVTSPEPNSYTIGRQGNATIIVSTGLLETLDDAELDTVLAHELAHVLNHDVTVMTMAVAPFRLARLLITTLGRILGMTGVIIYYGFYLANVLVIVMLILMIIGVVFLTVHDWIATVVPFIGSGPILGQEIRTDVTNGFSALIVYPSKILAALAIGGLFLIPVVLLLSVYYVILGVIPRRLSIYREYAADRGAALLTGSPVDFANALETLANATDRPTADLRQATDVQALCLVSSGVSDETENDATRQSAVDDSSLLETVRQRISAGIVAHPPIEDRIDRLREISRSLEE